MGLDNRPTMRRNPVIWPFAVAVLAGCAPALDWREVRPQGSGLVLLFPCKPASHARQVALAAGQSTLQLSACKAGGSTWALAVADVADPARVGPALAELDAAAARNLGATQVRPLPLQIDGATPNPASRRLQLDGRLPDGRAVTEQLAVFAKGTQVFQATVLGEGIEAEAAETFFRSLRFPP
jgi:hypothetical protein